MLSILLAGGNNQGIIHELDNNNINSLPTDTKTEHTTGNEVLIMNANDEDRTTSFFAQPGILAGMCWRTKEVYIKTFL